MGTYKWETGLSKTAEGISTECIIVISADEINAKAKANIPSNAIIDSVKTTVEMRQGYKTSKTDCNIVWAKDESLYASVVKYLCHDVSAVTNDWKTFEGNMTDDVYKSGLSVGQISLARANYLGYMNICTVGRKLLVRNPTIIWNYHIPTYTLTVNAGTGGTVTGGGTYESGTSVTIKATPNSGYKFVKWSDGNTNATRTVTVTGNATYTAVFTLAKTNKIYVGTAQPKAIYVGNQEVKGVYVGTTKVYG